MSEEDLKWIFDQPQQDLFLARKQVCNSYNAGPIYPGIIRRMGNDAWVRVLKGLMIRINRSHSRAQRHNFKHDLGLIYITDLWLEQKGRCSMTNMIMSFDSGDHNQKNHLGCSIDRIDSSKGYVKGNVRLLTHWANNAMNTWDDALFEQMIKAAHLGLTRRQQPV